MALIFVMGDDKKHEDEGGRSDNVSDCGDADDGDDTDDDREEDDDKEGDDYDDDNDHDNEKTMTNSRNSHSVGQKKRAVGQPMANRRRPHKDVFREEDDPPLSRRTPYH